MQSNAKIILEHFDLLIDYDDRNLCKPVTAFLKGLHAHGRVDSLTTRFKELVFGADHGEFTSGLDVAEDTPVEGFLEHCLKLAYRYPSQLYIALESLGATFPPSSSLSSSPSSPLAPSLRAPAGDHEQPDLEKDLVSLGLAASDDASADRGTMDDGLDGLDNNYGLSKNHTGVSRDFDEDEIEGVVDQLYQEVFGSGLFPDTTDTTDTTPSTNTTLSTNITPSTDLGDLSDMPPSPAQALLSPGYFESFTRDTDHTARLLDRYNERSPSVSPARRSTPASPPGLCLPKPLVEGPCIVPQKFALRFEPATIALYYQLISPGGRVLDTRLHLMSVTDLTKDTDPALVCAKLFQQHPAYLNPLTTSVMQLKRLVLALQKRLPASTPAPANNPPAAAQQPKRRPASPGVVTKATRSRAVPVRGPENNSTTKPHAKEGRVSKANARAAGAVRVKARRPLAAMPQQQAPACALAGTH